MKRYLLSAALVVACASLVISAVRGQYAPRPPQNFNQVQVISYASGMTGFFDSQTGRLYVYDSNMENCLFIRQINELGNPLKRLRDPDPKYSY